MIVRAPLNGGTTATLATTMSSLGDWPTPLATDGQYIYFPDGDGAKRVPLEGGSIDVVSRHTGAIALIGPNIIVADGVGGNVYSVPAAGGSETLLASMQSGASNPVTCADNQLCFATTVGSQGNGPGMVAAGAINALPLGGVPRILSQGPSLWPAWRMIVDGDSILLSTLGDASHGNLMRIPAAGGAPSLLIPDVNGLALDDECLYAASDGGIYSVARSVEDGSIQSDMDQ